MLLNQTPEQLARDQIDRLLVASGWVIQNKQQLNLTAGIGVAVREYSTEVGPADYVLFDHQRPLGIIEAKREDEGVRDFQKQNFTDKLFLNFLTKNIYYEMG
jgi:type I restriction enzyme R subunit